MERAWTSSVEGALGHFQVQRSQGLSDKQVADAQIRYGSNGSCVAESLIYRVEGRRFGSAVASGFTAVPRSARRYPSCIGYGFLSSCTCGK